jgi:hypothetical protein
MISAREFKMILLERSRWFCLKFQDDSMNLPDILRWFYLKVKVVLRTSKVKLVLPERSKGLSEDKDGFIRKVIIVPERSRCARLGRPVRRSARLRLIDRTST